MNLLESHTVPSNIRETRIYDYAVGLFPVYPTRKSVKKAIKKGLIRLDNEIVESSRWVGEGMIIQVYIEDITNLKKFDIKIPIVYEDDFFAVIHKPAGVAVSGNFFKTIQNAISHQLLEPSIMPDALAIPRPVHRLDKATSGLLLIAKTHQTLVHLSKQFEAKLISKSYHALVVGDAPVNGVITDQIDEKSAETHYSCILSSSSKLHGDISLLEVTPLTGRTHQIRKHLSSIGHPIIGDILYNENAYKVKKKGLFLSAISISFIHPLTEGPLTFSIDHPNKFDRQISYEALEEE